VQNVVGAARRLVLSREADREEKGANGRARGHTDQAESSKRAGAAFDDLPSWKFSLSALVNRADGRTATWSDAPTSSFGGSANSESPAALRPSLARGLPLSIPYGANTY
jgi:hypothetical protein